ncbi:DUF6344 domain-containing protein [Streptomyces sp. NBC_00536]|uniref:DUF6344 domain-containing protein n=1 Tax=Streptomyces sp. NBC_00536 TaxID=2975769 RepID=UPI002E805E5D|nr:DUF6344 domain-containing protein [Streptomyces sp. NBC_00536]WUC80196.1 DUF6344 domain-containing protein [Streptomyces sp. NBC_00536]
MASSNTFKSIWTSVLAALVALFAALGLGGSAAAPAASSVAAPAAPAVPAGSVARTMAAQARRSWRAMMRGGSLPPTIAQRIRAEAHGSTPSVRRRSTTAAAHAQSDRSRDALELVA